MAHELLIKNGEASMMYVDEMPWHGLGTKLDKPATAEEAIRAAKLDWQVEKRPLCYRDGKEIHEVPKRYVMTPGEGWKYDAKPIFGVVGDHFTPLQNRDAFSFFDPIVGMGAAIYHTAGALGCGERTWILAKLPGQIRVADDDITNKYLLLSNNHDGHGAVQIKFTPIRVVCNNTLTFALRRGPTLRVPHTRDMHQRLKHADELLGIIHEQYESIEEIFQSMVRVEMTAHHLTGYLERVFPYPDDPAHEKARTRAERDRACSAHLFEHGAGNDMPHIRRSLWAAYNGVTEYIDHRRMNTTDDGRLSAIWFGNGYLAKARAFSAAKSLLTEYSTN